jgi:hypothetical protein
MVDSAGSGTYNLDSVAAGDAEAAGKLRSVSYV